MKFVGAFVAIASLLGVVNAITRINIKNPVQCFQDPCKAKPCLPGERCVADYSMGCNRHCYRDLQTDPTPFECPVYAQNVSCKRAPCDEKPCAPNEICCDNYSNGCDRECFLQ